MVVCDLQRHYFIDTPFVMQLYFSWLNDFIWLRVCIRVCDFITTISNKSLKNALNALYSLAHSHWEQSFDRCKSTVNDTHMRWLRQKRKGDRLVVMPFSVSTCILAIYIFFSLFCSFAIRSISAVSNNTVYKCSVYSSRTCRELSTRCYRFNRF